MSSVFLQGNSRDVLKGLPENFFHCAVTSPPYLGLRKYSGGKEVWDGDESCQHDWVTTVKKDTRGVEGTGLKGRDPYKGGEARVDKVVGTCVKCGAWRGQLGAEPTPDLYISHLVQICREVKRVLRKDGVFFLVIGDSWAGSGGAHKPEHANPGLSRSASRSGVPLGGITYDGIKSLDMVLIPEQLALALRADGWYLRSILIWAKGVSCSDEYNGNPMPESVNGWRWEQHKVKVGDKGRGKEAWRVGANDTPQQDHAPDGSFQSSAVWQDCPGCPKCSPNGGYILRKGSWRPTDSYEQVLMLTKGSWESRVVKFSDFQEEVFHFGKDFRGTYSRVGFTVGLCVKFASSLFEFIQLKHDFSLPSFYSQEWKDCLNSESGFSGTSSPYMYRLAAFCASFMCGDMTAKKFVREIDGFQASLPNCYDFLKNWAESEFSCAPSAIPNGDRTIAVDYSSDVCQFNFTTHTLIIAHVGQTSYYCDREAVLERGVYPAGETRTGGDDHKSMGAGSRTTEGLHNKDWFGNGGRNLRSVLMIPTVGFKGAHFAVFPPRLVEPLIRAATSEKGCCPSCGSPWARVIDKQVGMSKDCPKTLDAHLARGGVGQPVGTVGKSGSGRIDGYTNTIGWLPTCQCGIQETESCRVLDPFSGAGTTALVCERLGLSSINIDTSAEYIQLSKTRLADDEQKRIAEFIKQAKRLVRVSVKDRGDGQGKSMKEVMPIAETTK